MALKPTIYKLQIALSDLDANFYDTLNLTVAQHPSETLERMMARVLAMCINAQQKPVFTAGLSTPDEPDMWVKTLDDQIALWVDVGEPTADRIKKAARQAQTVKVYSFNSKSSAWWQQESKAFGQLNAEIYQFDSSQVADLARMVERTMDIAVSITANSAYVSDNNAQCELQWVALTAN